MSKIPLSIPSLPVRFQPLGRASVFPAEATWSDKAAELSADYLSYGPFGRSAMENGTLEPVNRPNMHLTYLNTYLLLRLFWS